jgi:abequosyltransferase
MSNILLSICIPTYNRADLLFNNLNQIDKQLKNLPSHFSVEIIIQDNNSEDNTLLLANQFKQKDNRFKFFTNNYNIGAENNFALCIDRSIGEYIWVLSDDDFILDNKLNSILDLLYTHKPDFVYMNNFWYAEDFNVNEIPNNNEFKFKNYINNIAFLIKINYWITFVSSGIFKRSNLADSFDYKKYLGSNLIHVYWFLSSVLNSKLSIHIENVMIACKANNNSLNYNVFETFCINFRKMLKETFNYYKIEEKVLSSIDSKMLIDFLPNYVLNYRVNKNSFENYKVSKILHQQYKHKYEYWLIIFPLCYTPIIFSKIYLNIFFKLKNLKND